MPELADPRTFPDPSSARPEARRLYTLAEAVLSGAPDGREALALEAHLGGAITALLSESDGALLAATLEGAPSVAVYRQLWRVIAQQAADPNDGSLIRLFALPIVIIATTAEERAVVSGVLPDAEALVELLRGHGALGGNQTFTLANALVAADAIDIRALPALLDRGRRASRGAPRQLELAAAPLEVRSREAAHLRFLVGSAVMASEAKLTEESVGRWRMPLARALTTQLSEPRVKLLALPRPPMSLPAAIARGRAACREVALQLFASNALRELRATSGEPVAVISAHRAADAPGGGELRLSLSSPLSPRDAQGFRCPLDPLERVQDVVTMLVELLSQCRVADVRVVGGVHADREPVTGGRLLFKPDTIPAAGPL